MESNFKKMSSNARNVRKISSWSVTFQQVILWITSKFTLGTSSSSRYRIGCRNNSNSPWTECWTGCSEVLWRGTVIPVYPWLSRTVGYFCKVRADEPKFRLHVRAKGDCFLEQMIHSSSSLNDISRCFKRITYSTWRLARASAFFFAFSFRVAGYGVVR